MGMGEETIERGVRVAVKVKRIHHMASVPEFKEGSVGGEFTLRATVGDASDAFVTVGPGQRRLVGTGLVFGVETPTMGLFVLGLRELAERGVAIESGVDLIDTSQGQEVCVMLANRSGTPLRLHNRDPIARAVFLASMPARFVKFEEIDVG